MRKMMYSGIGALVVSIVILAIFFSTRQQAVSTNFVTTSEPTIQRNESRRNIPSATEITRIHVVIDPTPIAVIQSALEKRNGSKEIVKSFDVPNRGFSALMETFKGAIEEDKAAPVRPWQAVVELEVYHRGVLTQIWVFHTHKELGAFSVKQGMTSVMYRGRTDSAFVEAIVDAFLANTKTW